MQLSLPIPKSLGSTASRLCFGERAFSNTASSDSASRSRGASRSAGVSLNPSGTQTLVTQGVPSALPIAAPISRDRRQCSIQNFLIPLSACDRVNPSAALGCEKQVGLKSSPTPRLFAQPIQLAKCVASI